jgi:Fic family protein
MAYKPNFTITLEQLSQIAEIESIKAKIDGSYILPEREIELRHRATVEATHSSTSIEGNPLDYKQVEKVLSITTPLTRHKYAELEVRNYSKALRFIDKRKKTKQPITLHDILKIHAIIMEGLLPKDKIGTLRKNDVYIVDQDEAVQYTGPEASVLGNEIRQLLDWLGSITILHPVITSAILHFQFVSIHPFSDGNGRTARALVSLYLGLQNYDFRGSLVLDSYYSIAKQEYYMALHVAQGGNYTSATSANITSWIQYFAKGFLSSTKILFAEITLLSSIVSGIPRKGTINIDDADILAYAKQFGVLSLSDAEGVLPNTARRTLQRKLNNLVSRGYLVVEGKTRNTQYRWANKD